MRLFLDISRLHQRGSRSTPSGIDRVEFAYLCHTLDPDRWPHEVVHVLSPKLRAGALAPARAAEIHRQISKSWGAKVTPDKDPAYLALKTELEKPLGTAVSAIRLNGATPVAGWGQAIHYPRDVFRNGARLTRRLTRLSAAQSIYLHTSHSYLDQPELFGWLRLHQVPAVFFLHDVIPIDYPEFCRPGEDQRHLTRLKTISELATLVLVNSDYTAKAARAHFEANHWPVLRFITVPLGVSDCFHTRDGLLPPVSTHPYAIFVGTIEPRKNLAFLLAVWRRLVEQYGERTPRLVIAGRRGWENENVLDILERSSLLAPFILEVSDLGDAAIASAIAGAEVLLAPSIVEGFNLPIVEGLALATKVIASDIPVHREIAMGYAHLVDPLDGPAWARSIASACGLEGAPPLPSTPPGFKALTWAEHVAVAMQKISETLAEVAP